MYREEIIYIKKIQVNTTSLHNLFECPMRTIPKLCLANLEPTIIRLLYTILYDCRILKRLGYTLEKLLHISRVLQHRYICRDKYRNATVVKILLDDARL